MKCFPVGFTALMPLAWVGVAAAQPRAIDPVKSAMTVHVGKAGAFSAFGHNHEIAAPIDRGEVDVAAQRVELRVKANALQVRESKGSRDRDQIQSTMLGPDVLDMSRYPEIVFQSTAVESTKTGAWRLSGNLTLHGQTRPVTVSVAEKEGHYIGNALFKQTDFSITPVRIAGGAVRVKDEVRLDFDIQLAR